jgi:hypothetical protein
MHLGGWGWSATMAIAWLALIPATGAAQGCPQDELCRNCLDSVIVEG